MSDKVFVGERHGEQEKDVFGMQVLSHYREIGDTLWVFLETTVYGETVSVKAHAVSGDRNGERRHFQFKV